MNPFDKAVFEWLNGMHGRLPVFDAAMRIVTTDYLMPLAFSTVLICLWFAGSSPAQRFHFQWTSFLGMASLGFANLAVFLVNISWHRPRPFEIPEMDVHLLFYAPTDPSFPANPVAVGFAVGAAVWRAERRLGLAVCLLAALYGFARLYSGVFWPTDIIGGAILGAVVTWATLWLGRLLEPLPTLAIRLARAIGLG